MDRLPDTVVRRFAWRRRPQGPRVAKLGHYGRYVGAIMFMRHGYPHNGLD